MPKPNFKNERQRQWIIDEIKELDLQLPTGVFIAHNDEGTEGEMQVLKLNDQQAALTAIADYILEREESAEFKKILPTQEQFDKYHADPIEYGEADYLVISKTYTEEEALKRILALMVDWGVDPEHLPKEVTAFEIGWTVDPDSYHHSENTYHLASDKVPARWEAWGVNCS